MFFCKMRSKLRPKLLKRFQLISILKMNRGIRASGLVFKYRTGIAVVSVCYNKLSNKNDMPAICTDCFQLQFSNGTDLPP